MQPREMREPTLAAWGRAAPGSGSGAHSPATATGAGPRLATHTPRVARAAPCTRVTGITTSPSRQPRGELPASGGPSPVSRTSSSGPGRPRVPTRRRTAPASAGTRSPGWHARRPAGTSATNASGRT